MTRIAEAMEHYLDSLRDRRKLSAHTVVAYQKDLGRWL